MPIASVFEGLPGNVGINTAAYYGNVGLNAFNGNISPSIAQYNLGSNVQVKYLVGTSQVQLIKPDGGTITFSASELDMANSGEGAAIFARGTAYEDIPEELLELRVPKINDVFLTYTRFGTYAKINVSVSPSINPLTAFVFGQVTPNGSMPTSGSANYVSDIVGAVVEENPSASFPKLPNFYTLGDGNGSATFNVNFSSGVINTLISLDANGKDFGDLTGTGAILSGGPAFNGTLTGAATGGFTGAFFGLSAEEMGYVFQATNPNFVTYGNVFGVVAPPP